MLKHTPQWLALVLGISLLLSGCLANAQDAAAGDRLNAPWRYQKKYDRYVRDSCFTPGMSDDEMAGIYLWRGGRNLKMSFSFNMVGVIVGSTASWLPGLLYDKFDLDPDRVTMIIAGVSSAFILVGVCELISGYSKIAKAGIILQHNRFNVRVTGTTVSLNF